MRHNQGFDMTHFLFLNPNRLIDSDKFFCRLEEHAFQPFFSTHNAIDYLRFIDENTFSRRHKR